ncbi:MAG: ABC transporter ATP-binding protein, partial [Deinococcota bacterium]
MTVTTTSANPQGTSEPPQPSKELGLWDIITPVNREIYTGMVISVLSVVFWFTSIVLTLPISRELIADTPRIGRIWGLIGLSLGAVMIAFLCRIFSFRVSHLGAFRLEQILRTDLSSHLAKVPLGYVMNTGSGALKKIVLDDVRALHAFVADSTPLFAKAYAGPVLGIGIMFALDWRLALISLALFPLGMVGMALAFKDYDVARKQVDDANEHINAVIIEYVQGMQVVRTFDDGSSSFQRYKAALNSATEAVKAWTGKSQVGAFIARLLFAALPAVLVVLGAGIALVQAGRLELPMLPRAQCAPPRNAPRASSRRHGQT